jgi:predicted metal-binding membrane protein
MHSALSSRRAFYGVVALVVASSAAATVAWCASMHAMNGMPMEGDAVAATSWTLASRHGALASAARFVGMWVVMTPAMMLPSLAPQLWRYRVAAERSGAPRPGLLTVLAVLGYLAVWGTAGSAAWLGRAALIDARRQTPGLAGAVPVATGLVVIVMGAIQLTAWKARQLRHCRFRSAHDGARRASAGSSWRHGVRLGIDCLRCCANLMAILLVVGAMDLRTMTVVTVAITLERLAPEGARIARVTGALALGAGVVSIGLAIGQGVEVLGLRRSAGGIIYLQNASKYLPRGCLMTELSESLQTTRTAVDDMIRTAHASADRWTTPRAAGKWTPAQVIEHVALALEASAAEIAGRPTRFPTLPRPVRVLVRTLLFNRVLRSGTFPKAKANPAMTPDDGPATPADAERRLAAAWRALEEAAIRSAAAGDLMTSVLFGRVRIADYVTFQGYHARHHRAQMTWS